MTERPGEVQAGQGSPRLLPEPPRLLQFDPELNVVVSHRYPPMDYWAPVRPALERLRTTSIASTAPFLPPDFFGALKEVLAYIQNVHGAHASALSMLRKYVEHGTQYALCLRNFQLTGSGKLLVTDTGLERHYKHEDAFLGDSALLPLLAAGLKDLPVLGLCNLDTFRGDSVKLAAAGVGFFRAHGYNWQDVVERLIRGAKVVVLASHKYVRSMQRECDLLCAQQRQGTTVCIVRDEMNSVAIREFDRIGRTMERLEFLSYRMTSIAELYGTGRRVAAPASPGGDPTARNIILPTGKISPAGQALLDDVVAEASDTKTDAVLPLLGHRCFIVERELSAYPEGIDPGADGFFVDHTQFDGIPALSQAAAEWNSAGEAVKQVKNDPEDADQRIEAERRLVGAAVRMLVAAVDLERYGYASYALASIALRGRVRDPAATVLVAEGVRLLDVLTGDFRNSDRLGLRS